MISFIRSWLRPDSPAVSVQWAGVSHCCPICSPDTYSTGSHPLATAAQDRHMPRTSMQTLKTRVIKLSLLFPPALCLSTPQCHWQNRQKEELILLLPPPTSQVWPVMLEPFWSTQGASQGMLLTLLIKAGERQKWRWYPLNLYSNAKWRAVFSPNSNFTYNHRENPAGILASYFLIQLWVIKLKTLHKRLKALVSCSLKNVQKNTWNK